MLRLSERKDDSHYSSVVLSIPSALFMPQKLVAALNPNPNAPTRASKPVLRFRFRSVLTATTASRAASSART